MSCVLPGYSQQVTACRAEVPAREGAAGSATLQHAVSLQVHGAVLAKGLAHELGWRWRRGRGLVLKLQKADMRGLMDADVRNLRRLSAFVGDSLPFSPLPVRLLLPLSSRVRPVRACRPPARVLPACCDAMCMLVVLL